MCGFMGKRKKRKGARGGGRGEQGGPRRAEARASLVFDPATRPDRAAAILRETFHDGPVDMDVARAIVTRNGIDRLRAVAEAALVRGRDAMALSLAADVALMERRPDAAEEHATHALRLVDDPDLHVRLALAHASRGRLADAIETLDAQLGAYPWLERAMFTRARLLEQVQRSGAPSDEERRALDRFSDRTPLTELMAAAVELVAADAGSTGTLAGGAPEWVDAGAVTEEELAAWTVRAAADPVSPEAGRLALITEWAWLTPAEDGASPVSRVAGDERLPTALRRRAEDWVSSAMWGLWELAPPDGTPGVVLSDLITGVRIHAEVPEAVVDGLPRWSSLLGCLVPVDGYWRAGSSFEVASPIEARVLAHEFVHGLAGADELGEQAMPAVRWARRAHDDFDVLRLADAAEPAPPDVMPALQVVVRMLVPQMVAVLRVLRGEVEFEDDSADRWSVLTLDDPAAAWRALAGHAEFELDGEDLVWVGGIEDEEDPVARARLERSEDGQIAVEAGPDDLAALLDLLGRVGHPATAEEVEVAADGPPEAPVALPHPGAIELADWLRVWPDEPLECFGGLSAREAVGRHDAGADVEMLVRYLEHDADRRGLAGLDTGALRTALGLTQGLENE